VTDPWEEFSARANGSECAGYFETGARGTHGSATATWFDRAEEVRSIDRSTDLGALARESDRFLHGGRDRAILGYLGFDAVGLLEPALRRFPRGSPFPLGEFAFAQRVRTRRVPPRTGPPPSLGARRLPRPRADSLSRTAYGRAVRRTVQDIREGEAFQVVLAHRREWTRPLDLLSRAGRLRATERFAFFYYLRFGDREVVGATPESVVETDGGRAFVNPIAGTLPHARTRRGRRPLSVDPKELAEHRMLVDLARNDLGRVAEPGTVELLWQERSERFARLEHLVSRVAARLRRGVGPWETLAATFPAGTVSGAPKIRATEILRREESTWRGPYGGATGLLRSGGRADWALTIRSGFAAGGRLYTAAGAGIVHRSRPRREYEETLVKLAHVEAALVGDPA